MGAALSYYMLFSLPGIASILILLAGIFIGNTNAEATLLQDLGGHVGEASSAFLNDVVTHSNNFGNNIIEIFLSLLLLLIAGTGIFNELRTSLGRLWNMPALPRAPRAIHHRALHIVKSTIPNIFLLFILGTFFLVSIFGNLLIQGVGNYIPFVANLGLIGIAASLFSFILTTCFFAYLYRAIAGNSMSLESIFLGACITTILFILGEYIIGLYLRFFAHPSVYGGARSIVGVLLWVYYSAQVFYLGASFTYALSRKKESLKQ